MSTQFKIGDKIKDVEDGDCYYLGIWKGDNTYLVTSVIWDGIKYDDDNLVGQVIEPKWWYLKHSN